MNHRHMNRRLAATAATAAALCLCALCGCGQKGALYLPDHTPRVVVPANAPPPPAPADANAAPATDGTTTRKAPRDPDPANAR